MLVPFRMEGQGFTPIDWFIGLAAHCYTDARGAWTLRIGVVPALSGPAKEATIELVRLQDGREETLLVDRVALDGDAKTYQCAATAYDFDQDLVAELFLSCRTLGDSDFKTKRVRTMATYTNGHIEPFTPARPFDIEEVRDVDGDGTPEIAYVYFRSPELNCTQSSPYYTARWMPNHTFSTTAPGWDRLLRESCPSPPSSQMPDHEPWRWVACSRLWGVKASEVRDRTKRGCSEESEARFNDLCHKPCDFPESLNIWLTAPPRALR